ncbi:hypothetical protein [Nocardioides sp. SYSU DS0651]|uniref:hypothetical protein n=1 Tax=Nocardioides sp. SYSU DS0651 TaxID=3415955 RepID=UPI003F4BE540
MPSPRRLALPSLALAAVVAAAPAQAGSPAGSPAPAAAAVAAACGQPGVPAVLATVHHEATYTTIEEQSHAEWLWARDVPTVETRYVRTVEQVLRSYEWSRPVLVDERQHSRLVVDQPYVPAVPEQGRWETRTVPRTVQVTEWEYEQRQTGRTVWRDQADWNPGQGWNLTGATRVVEDVRQVTEDVWIIVRPAVPEVPEVSHLEYLWLLDGAAAPAGYTATGATRSTSTGTEVVRLPEGQQPSGDGWTRGAWTETASAITEERWVAEGEPSPGFEATDDTRPGTPRREVTADTSPVPPEGEGWSEVPGSLRVVVDVEAGRVQVTDPWDEVVLVTPAVPATAPCPDAAPGEVDPAVEEAGVRDTATGTGRAPAPMPMPADSPAAADALPAAGAPVDPWLAGLGAVSVLLGAGLLLRRRTP